jgi:hypothetical protein
MSTSPPASLRQGDGKRCSLTGFTDQPDSAPMHIHNLPDQVESQSQPGHSLVRQPLPPFEDSFRQGWIDTRLGGWSEKVGI